MRRLPTWSLGRLRLCSLRLCSLRLDSLRLDMQAQFLVQRLGDVSIVMVGMQLLLRRHLLLLLQLVLLEHCYQSVKTTVEGTVIYVQNVNSSSVRPEVSGQRK